LLLSKVFSLRFWCGLGFEEKKGKGRSRSIDRSISRRKEKKKIKRKRKKERENETMKERGSDNKKWFKIERVFILEF
jgi:hypothetical protein